MKETRRTAERQPDRIKPSHLGQLSHLSYLQAELNNLEQTRFAPAACPSEKATRRKKEAWASYRQEFAIDCDRILHSKAYSRYIDKTQVFSLVANDHITHRALHVQLVARIARTIGRYLRLNEDLIEAIALGHDIGHPPFGHDGERILSELCAEHGLSPFQHNVQSVTFLDKLERKGAGWNLTIQTLDGILCHDGESRFERLEPHPFSFDKCADFADKLEQKTTNPRFEATPATLEGCVVRAADTIGYIGRDIEDAITLGLIKRSDIPPECEKRFGITNGTIVYNLVTDLLQNSESEAAPGFIAFSQETAQLLQQLKTFNYEHIYLNPAIKDHLPMIRRCYRALFEHYLMISEKGTTNPGDQIDLMTDITADFPYLPAERVRDYLAGMTDAFFLRQAESIGCDVQR